IVSVSVIPAQDPPVGFIASEIIPSETQVKVVGPRMLVERVAEARATINLQNQSISFVRSLELRAIGADNTIVEGVTLSPAEITVSVKIQERDDVTGLQVVPSYIGTPAEGYQLKSDNWSPRRIFVRGDSAAIAAMNGVITTEDIDLTGRDQTFTQSMRLQLPAGVTMPDPTDITITVVIEPVLITREFSGIPVQTQGLDPADYEITVKPDRVRVRITGPQRIVSALTEEDISVFAPLTGLGVGKHLVTLEASVAAAELATGNIDIPDEQAEVTISDRTATPKPTVTATPARVTRTPTPTVTVAPSTTVAATRTP
ncbi:MAG: hypothetical protein KF726_24625, partial [Anaerolineae bacterium]|nr:hypothetical protein [Anaerolineae bacterium]